MLIIARALAVLSVLLTLVVIEIIGLQYVPIGFEATGVFGVFLLATVAAVSALVIAIVRGRSEKRVGSSSIVVLSGISLLGRGQSRLLTDVQSWSARPRSPRSTQAAYWSGGRAAYEKIWLVLRIQMVGSTVIAKEERLIP
jgi:hypothetical protein